MVRGCITDEVQAVAKRHLGREISVKELRLLPYLMYIMMNNDRLERHKVSEEEKTILYNWQDEGLIKFVDGGMFSSIPKVTSKFYDAIVDILKVGYCSVCISKEENNC